MIYLIYLLAGGAVLFIGWKIARWIYRNMWHIFGIPLSLLTGLIFFLLGWNILMVPLSSFTAGVSADRTTMLAAAAPAPALAVPTATALPAPPKAPALTCRYWTPFPNGLQPGHQPQKVSGPAVVAAWDPNKKGPETEYVSTVPEGQSQTMTKPGQIFQYSIGCTPVLESEANNYVRTRAEAEKHRNLQVVRGLPPGGI